MDSDPGKRRAWLGVALVICLLAFAFQGTRGLWEPDEGFYTNPALDMLRSGDWWLPRLNGEPFLDKPPLVYWSIAGGMRLLGANEWGARAVHALWYLGTALVVGLLGARWWGRRTGLLASLVYATSLAPFLAANVLTPDTPLAFFATLSYYAYWRLEEHEAPAARISWSRISWPRISWGGALGAALGLGALAKGPAILVLGAPLGVVTLLRRRRLGRWLGDPGYVTAGIVFVAFAVPWYLLMATKLPGAASYLFDNQVLGRLATSDYARNATGFAGLEVYLPVLLFGTLPWNLLWARRAAGGLRFPRLSLAGIRSRPVALLLAAWLLLPLAVFCAARSRLPLYILPLFAPLSLVFARGLTSGEQPRPRARAWFLGWLLVLLALKGTLGVMPYAKDCRHLADELDHLGVSASVLVVLVDIQGNALPLYGFSNVEQVTVSKHRYPFYRLTETFTEEVEEIVSDGDGRALVVAPARLPEVTHALTGAGILFTTRALAEAQYLLVVVEPQKRG